MWQKTGGIAALAGNARFAAAATQAINASWR
jgi:hypothetical protein